MQLVLPGLDFVCVLRPTSGTILYTGHLTGPGLDPAGASTAWPRSAPRRPGRSQRRSPKPRSVTRSGSTSARPGTATARAWSRRPTTPRCSAGGAPSPTTPPSPLLVVTATLGGIRRRRSTLDDPPSIPRDQPTRKDRHHHVPPHSRDLDRAALELTGNVFLRLIILSLTWPYYLAVGLVQLFRGSAQVAADVRRDVAQMQAGESLGDVLRSDHSVPTPRSRPRPAPRSPPAAGRSPGPGAPSLGDEPSAPVDLGRGPSEGRVTRWLAPLLG